MVKKAKIMLLSIMMTIIVGVIAGSYSFGSNTLIELQSGNQDQEITLNIPPLSTQKVSGVQYNPLNPIYIDDDGDFLTQGFTGLGTPSEPYLLYNRSITNSTSTLIHIQDTTAHFIIRNCSLNALASSNNGIYLENVKNGVFYNNTIANSSYCGIWVNQSTNNDITSNTISNCTNYGISLLESKYSTLTYNTIFNCTGWSIYLRSSNNTLISNNTISNYSLDGIHIATSSNNTIANNTISNDETGIFVYYSENINLSGNTIYNCTLYGINFVFSFNNLISGNTIYNCAALGIYLDYANNCTLTDNTIFKNNQYGVVLYNSYNTSLSYNTICNNTEFGIYLDNSHNNKIFANIVSNNGNDSIYLTSFSENNFFLNNTIYNNTGYGIYLNSTCQGNIVEFNNFANNTGGTSQAYDKGLFNNINHNYWNEWTLPDDTPADGIVDTPYAVDGGSNTDLYPLTTSVPPILIITTPTSPLYGNDTIIVLLSGNIEYYWYYIEGADSVNQTWNYSSSRSLSDGTYTLHAYGNDSFGIIVHTYTTFTIDTIPPSVSIIRPMNTTYQNNLPILTYNVSDGIVAIYFNGMINTSALINGSYISNIREGSNNITILAVDQAGNIGKNTLIFTIGFPHTILTPVLLTPDGGVFVEEMTVIWNPANDSYQHPIIYDILYSSDSGTTWNLIDSNVSGTTYDWNIKKIPNGSDYQIKLIARCSIGTEIEVISSPFAIENEISSSITPQISPGLSFSLIIMIGILFVVIQKRRSRDD